jgi:hypothetical protein
MIQLLLLFCILLFVLQADARASFAADQLLQFNEEESMLLLKLQRIEHQSIQLHENIRKRLQRAGIQYNNDDADADEEGGDDPFGKQMSHLYEMSDELNEQVGTLRQRITKSSIDDIIEEYGEGPIKVVLELEFLELDHDDDHRPTTTYRDNEAKSTRMSILLWPDTPHAAWTWLEQIGRHIWDDAEFRWESPTQPSLELTPTKMDPLQRGQLEFVEHHDHPNLHGAWTVGLRETEEGMLQMFLNLQENGEYQKHETCVGKVVDGFHALQKLMEATRLNGNASSIRVKRMSAMHMSKRDMAMNHI